VVIIGLLLVPDVLAGALAAGAWLVVLLIVLLPESPRPGRPFAGWSPVGRRAARIDPVLRRDQRSTP
jgi:hypothetical protein